MNERNRNFRLFYNLRLGKRWLDNNFSDCKLGLQNRAQTVKNSSLGFFQEACCKLVQQPTDVLGCVSKDQGVPGTALAIESLPNIAHGSYLSASRYITLPSVTLLFTVCPPLVAWCQHTSLTATADEGETPWHVDYSVRKMRTAPLPVS